jgi:hypothetical protein
MTRENTEQKLSDYGMSPADVAMRDMMHAPEAERAARQTYEMEGPSVKTGLIRSL